MLFDPKYENRLDRLTDELRIAPTLTPDLFSRIIAEACRRIAVLNKAGKTRRLDQFIAVGAWTDAALALVKLELPMWEVRRLAYEDGEWFCSLSRQPNLPVGLDDTVDASDAMLPLAILAALIEAKRRNAAAVRDTNSTTVPKVRPATGVAICCDNFA
jgi:hypothetical protein